MISYLFYVGQTIRIRNHRQREDLYPFCRCYGEKFVFDVPSLVMFFPHTETTGHIVILV